MSSEWEGKSKGSVFGYRVFVFLIKNLGVKAAYLLLFFVALYYCFFAPSNVKAIFYYFNSRLKYSKFKSIVHVYKSFVTFGKTIIDKVAISSGMRDSFTYDFDGRENIKNLLDNKQGGILISAHVGNFEISEFFFAELDQTATISLVVTDAERQAIKEYLSKYTRKSHTKFIVIKEDISHIFEINAALARNEIVCMTGDRYIKGTKFMEEQLLGETARFPAGPFMIASRLKVPVIFVYVMKDPKQHYHLYARTAQNIHRDAPHLLREYTKSVEWMLKKYPKQWFNYFDFWNLNKAS
ncbi:LpxL/LpxP family acyltransferase [Patiriisocius marinus]|uniref:Lipid A biosynthesis acyltransferase n=1 Tax=Patiriisocius marinus TaxID=1397112 RepID=A0A5J4IXM1_9FLAO|nr:lipid A biosynthesis acyltransferase [Patiriisocius marinus]GER58338.1 lipid A biosynthesis acyltransferase [Patiriisocius marinus]